MQHGKPNLRVVSVTDVLSGQHRERPNAAEYARKPPLRFQQGDGPTADPGGAASGMVAGYTAAWNSGNSESVVEFFTPNCEVSINGGPVSRGAANLANLVEDFLDEVPNLSLVCDGCRIAGDQVAYLWTLTGHHVETGKALRFSGWSEWDLEDGTKIKCSRGWFNASEYYRQAGIAAPKPRLTLVQAPSATLEAN